MHRWQIELEVLCCPILLRNKSVMTRINREIRKEKKEKKEKKGRTSPAAL
jgi:hypothetical protein